MMMELDDLQTDNKEESTQSLNSAGAGGKGKGKSSSSSSKATGGGRVKGHHDQIEEHQQHSKSSMSSSSKSSSSTARQQQPQSSSSSSSSAARQQQPSSRRHKNPLKSQLDLLMNGPFRHRAPLLLSSDSNLPMGVGVRTCPMTPNPACDPQSSSNNKSPFQSNIESSHHQHRSSSSSTAVSHKPKTSSSSSSDQQQSGERERSGETEMAPSSSTAIPTGKTSDQRNINKEGQSSSSISSKSSSQHHRNHPSIAGKGEGEHGKTSSSSINAPTSTTAATKGEDVFGGQSHHRSSSLPKSSSSSSSSHRLHSKDNNHHHLPQLQLPNKNLMNGKDKSDGDSISSKDKKKKRDSKAIIQKSESANVKSSDKFRSHQYPKKDKSSSKELTKSSSSGKSSKLPHFDSSSGDKSSSSCFVDDEKPVKKELSKSTMKGLDRIKRKESKPSSDPPKSEKLSLADADESGKSAVSLSAKAGRRTESSKPVIKNESESSIPKNDRKKQSKKAEVPNVEEKKNKQKRMEPGSDMDMDSDNDAANGHSFKNDGHASDSSSSSLNSSDSSASDSSSDSEPDEPSPSLSKPKAKKEEPAGKNGGSEYASKLPVLPTAGKEKEEEPTKLAETPEKSVDTSFAISEDDESEDEDSGFVNVPTLKKSHRKPSFSLVSSPPPSKSTKPIDAEKSSSSSLRPLSKDMYSKDDSDSLKDSTPKKSRQQPHSTVDKAKEEHLQSSPDHSVLQALMPKPTPKEVDKDLASLRSSVVLKPAGKSEEHCISKDLEMSDEEEPAPVSKTVSLGWDLDQLLDDPKPGRKTSKSSKESSSRKWSKESFSKTKPSSSSSKESKTSTKTSGGKPSSLKLKIEKTAGTAAPMTVDTNCDNPAMTSSSKLKRSNDDLLLSPPTKPNRKRSKDRRGNSSKITSSSSSSSKNNNGKTVINSSKNKSSSDDHHHHHQPSTSSTSSTSKTEWVKEARSLSPLLSPIPKFPPLQMDIGTGRPALPCRIDLSMLYNLPPPLTPLSNHGGITSSVAPPSLSSNPPFSSTSTKTSVDIDDLIPSESSMSTVGDLPPSLVAAEDVKTDEESQEDRSDGLDDGLVDCSGTDMDQESDLESRASCTATLPPTLPSEVPFLFSEDDLHGQQPSFTSPTNSSTSSNLPVKNTTTSTLSTKSSSKKSSQNALSKSSSKPSASASSVSKGTTDNVDSDNTRTNDAAADNNYHDDNPFSPSVKRPSVKITISKNLLCSSTTKPTATAPSHQSASSSSSTKKNRKESSVGYHDGTMKESNNNGNNNNNNNNNNPSTSSATTTTTTGQQSSSSSTTKDKILSQSQKELEKAQRKEQRRREKRERKDRVRKTAAPAPAPAATSETTKIDGRESTTKNYDNDGHRQQQQNRGVEAAALSSSATYSASTNVPNNTSGNQPSGSSINNNNQDIILPDRNNKSPLLTHERLTKEKGRDRDWADEDEGGWGNSGEIVDEGSSIDQTGNHDQQQHQSIRKHSHYSQQQNHQNHSQHHQQHKPAASELDDHNLEDCHTSSSAATTVSRQSFTPQSTLASLSPNPSCASPPIATPSVSASVVGASSSSAAEQQAGSFAHVPTPNLPALPSAPVESNNNNSNTNNNGNTDGSAAGGGNGGGNNNGRKRPAIAVVHPQEQTEQSASASSDSVVGPSQPKQPRIRPATNDDPHHPHHPHNQSLNRVLSQMPFAPTESVLLEEELKPAQFYLNQKAKPIKHEADALTSNRLGRMLLYLESIVYFIMTTRALQKEYTPESSRAYAMINETYQLLKQVSNKFNGSSNGLAGSLVRRITCLSMQCLSILSYHLYYAKKSIALANYNAIIEFQQHQRAAKQSGSNKERQSPYSGCSTPSPASTVSSSAASTSGVPQHMETINKQQLDILHNLMLAHTHWEQSNINDLPQEDKEFFSHLGGLCGRLELDSSLPNLCNYLMTAVRWCKDILVSSRD